MPSSWRPLGSGEPMTCRKMGSQFFGFAGRSSRRNITAFDVPPRMNTARSRLVSISSSLLAQGIGIQANDIGRPARLRRIALQYQWIVARHNMSRGRSQTLHRTIPIEHFADVENDRKWPMLLKIRIIVRRIRREYDPSASGPNPHELQSARVTSNQVNRNAFRNLAGPVVKLHTSLEQPLDHRGDCLEGKTQRGMAHA